MHDKTYMHNNRFRRYAYQTLFGFSITYAFLYTGRLNMGLVLPMIVKELGWSLSMASAVNSAFFWVYSLGNLVNGRLGELLGLKRFILIGILFSVFTNWIVSFFSGPIIIAILWGLNGYFQSMVWAPGMSILSKWWPRTERGFATGIANSFSGIAQILAWVVVAVSIKIIPAWGWRAAFRLPVVLLLVVSFFYWYITQEKPSEVGFCDYEEDDIDVKLKKEYANRTLYPYALLLKQWHFDFYCIIVALCSIVRYGLLTWVPIYYVTTKHLDVHEGIITSLVLPLGMATGTFIIPWVTDKLKRSNRSLAVTVCAGAAILTVLMFPRVSDLLFASFILFWAGFFVYGISGVAGTYALDVGTRVFAGTATGILQWAGYMGTGLQTIVFGYILDRIGSWTLFFLTLAIGCMIIAILAAIVSIKTSKYEDN